MQKQDDKQLLVVDPRAVAILSDEGGKLVFSAEAEQALITLFEMKEVIDAAIDRAKATIAETGLAYNPNFTSVQGDKVKAGYRYFGSKYRIDQANFEKLPAAMYKTKVSHSPDTKAIDEFLKEHGNLPLGINYAERTRQVSLRIMEPGEEE